ncbi:DNA-packaging protein FI [Escherichia coli]|uniref:DNA-packaging protein FI n=1 Tax=Escherichia coli TaxID=562 RepID=UPI000A189778|nr:gifsy-1 prophage DNA packaging protein gp9 [Escherichia coli T426]
MTKEQMTERLQELAVVLGREADISGSKADLEQRLAEWEEEAAGLDEAAGPGAVFDDTSDTSSSEEMHFDRGLVRVRMLKMVHMPACDAVTGKMLIFAPAFGVVLVNEATVPALLADGLAEKIRSDDVR